MNQTNLLQKLTITGLVALGGVTLATPQKAQAGTVYSYSELNIIDLIITGVEDLDFETETSTSAVINPPLTSDGGIGEFDASQSFVTLNGVPSAPENFFDPWGTPLGGPQGPNFARGDVLINGNNLLTDFDGVNLGEAFCNGLVFCEAEGDGEWEAVSEFFDIAPGDQINFTADYSYLLAAEITGWDPGESKFTEAEFAFDFEINGRDANGDVTVLRQFTLDESIGVANANSFEQDSDSGSLASNFAAFTAEELEGLSDFNIVVDAIEVAAVRKRQDQKVPEPATIFGLLTVGGLGLGLKRKKQS